MLSKEQIKILKLCYTEPYGLSELCAALGKDDSYVKNLLDQELMSCLHVIDDDGTSNAVFRCNTQGMAMVELRQDRRRDALLSFLQFLLGLFLGWFLSGYEPEQLMEWLKTIL